ncbi:hypothetical protein GGTG_01533 [Gaeumannomyces tritici R3-111a-1]|uniref:Uncharacterized protein n=1 Tax=Gaeumannomyces tritici (strain R3-111a-1) TaxID=644352 RepID=J3NJV2_GAET3|nr:hypothetical protein GGTG_01533 [Gaeumannomyces tritici R3-111a-1]EJT81555.1 hypothetical protein GGTG_01533 [Gaeumannomyces tritici R3-111a-1]
MERRNRVCLAGDGPRPDKTLAAAQPTPDLKCLLRGGFQPLAHLYPSGPTRDAATLKVELQGKPWKSQVTNLHCTRLN